MRNEENLTAIEFYDTQDEPMLERRFGATREVVRGNKHERKDVDKTSNGHV